MDAAAYRGGWPDGMAEVTMALTMVFLRGSADPWRRSRGFPVTVKCLPCNSLQVRVTRDGDWIFQVFDGCLPHYIMYADKTVPVPDRVRRH
jgi:hypothetical protein